MCICTHTHTYNLLVLEAEPRVPTPVPGIGNAATVTSAHVMLIGQPSWLGHQDGHYHPYCYQICG